MIAVQQLLSQYGFDKMITQINYQGNIAVDELESPITEFDVQSQGLFMNFILFYSVLELSQRISANSKAQ